MKVYERVLKACLNRTIVVRYGRCGYSGRSGRCEVEGILLAYDNLCLLVGVVDRDGKLLKVVLIDKREVESIELREEKVIKEAIKTILEG